MNFYDKAVQTFNSAIQYNTLPIVVMLIGLPGSGKSTFRKEFLNNVDEDEFMVLSTDDMLETRAARMGIPYHEAYERYIGGITDIFFSSIRECCETQKSCIIDRTNTTMGGRSKIMANFSAEKFFKIGVFFEPDVGLSKQRIADRAKETGKLVPDEAVDMMAERFSHPDHNEFDLIICANKS